MIPGRDRRGGVRADTPGGQVLGAADGRSAPDAPAGRGRDDAGRIASGIPGHGGSRRRAEARTPAPPAWCAPERPSAAPLPRPALREVVSGANDGLC